MSELADSQRRPAVPARALIFVVELYRNMISPLRLPSCRFVPTCSEYAVEALREYGFIRGSWLSLVRLAKCGPWHPGGWDPVPEPSVAGRKVKARGRRGVSADRAESEHIVV